MSVNDTAAHLAQLAYEAAIDKHMSAEARKAAATRAAEAYQEAVR
jgi:hypothetical protein